MRPFEYFEPKTVGEAVSLLGRFPNQANLLAGGTDLLVEIKEQLKAPDYVINIKKIANSILFLELSNWLRPRKNRP